MFDEICKKNKQINKSLKDDKIVQDFRKKADSIRQGADNEKFIKDIAYARNFDSYKEHLFPVDYLKKNGFNPDFSSNIVYILSIYKTKLDALGLKKSSFLSDRFRLIIDNNLWTEKKLSQVVQKCIEELIEQAENIPEKKKVIRILKQKLEWLIGS